MELKELLDAQDLRYHCRLVPLSTGEGDAVELYTVYAAGEAALLLLAKISGLGFVQAKALENGGEAWYSQITAMDARRVPCLLIQIKPDESAEAAFSEKLKQRCSGLADSVRKGLSFQRGKLVVLLGVDGSGKSTQLAALQEVPALRLFDTRYYYGGNNAYRLPLLNDLKRRQQEGERIPFLLKKAIGYLALLDRRLRVKDAMKWVRRGRYVIFDRYFYDDLLFFEKIKLAGNNVCSLRYLKRRILSGRLGRVPDHTFFLELDAETSIARKHEHTVEIIQANLDAYRSLLTNRKEVTIIDATLPPKSITNMILQKIAE